MINAQQLVKPDRFHSAEWLRQEDWEEANRQLRCGEAVSDVRRRLLDWAHQYRYEALASSDHAQRRATEGSESAGAACYVLNYSLNGPKAIG